MARRLGGFSLFAAAVMAAIALAAPYAARAAERQDAVPFAEEVKPALKTIVNPHEQISDEGYVLWETCTVCHGDVPDPKKAKSINDVRLRFEADLTELCYRCHPVKPHPGAEGVSVMMSGFTAPDHLKAPSPVVRANYRLALKDFNTILPLDPKTGKVTCITCHNPHERGVLIGRADTGADSVRLLRTGGVDICQFCHRK